VTLRARLTALLVVLLAVGLIAADVATYTALRSFLLRRVDQQLYAARIPAAAMLSHPIPQGQPGGPPEDSALPSGTYAGAFDASGHVLVQQFFKTYGGAKDPPGPDLPSSIVALGGPDPAPFTVRAVSGSLRYRVLSTSLQGGGALVVAIPLTEMTDTLRRLVGIALFVTLAVLLAMAAVSWWTVRRGLRPLERIEQTAGAIAAGDLSKRVEETDPRTEVGRLGSALNVMLGRIEQSMDERLASEEALRRFLADASHELRTPLTSIRGYAELFRRGAGDDPADTALSMRRIEQESARMGTLVEDLLFLARAGQGRPIARKPVDLSRVASDAVQDARVVDPGRRIGLDAPDELIVTGDEDRLRQVVANLLGNALTHTPSGGPVRVRLRQEPGFAVLEVSDEGPGIAPQDVAHIFEPFYRADASRERVRIAEGGPAASGAGLGLSIVAAIAEAHGGEASVKSEPGEGTTVSVRLPVEPPARPDDPQEARTTFSATPKHGERTSNRVVGTTEVEEDD
jgi:two-component system, OmpR family, sensor kinase